MELYIKNEKIKSREKIVLYKTIEDELYQIINPSHEMLIEDGWELYVAPEKTIEQLKESKIEEITIYDKSRSVNEFYIENMSLWLSREERIVIKDRFTREIERGITLTKLRYEGLSIELDPLMGIQMIDALSAYADACFDVTEDHKAAVRLLETKEDIEKYDYTIGYPDKLTFEL